VAIFEPERDAVVPVLLVVLVLPVVPVFPGVVVVTVVVILTVVVVVTVVTVVPVFVVTLGDAGVGVMSVIVTVQLPLLLKPEPSGPVASDETNVSGPAIPVTLTV
jgi:hypothetical protein